MTTEFIAQYGDDPAFAELYDNTPLYAERPDTAFWVALARESGGPVLELGCGTGRVLLPTAEAGLENVGLDQSPGMLDLCRRHIAEARPEVRARASAVEGDMRTFDLGRQFRLVTIPFRPFQHLMAVEDQIACLRSIHSHLTPGGRLAFDAFNPRFDFLARQFPTPEVEDMPETALPDGRRIRRTSRNLATRRDTQTTDVEIVYYVTEPDGQTNRTVTRFPMRYYFRFELEHLLVRCGFDIVAIHGDYARTPFGPDSPEIVTIAERRT